MFLYIVTIREIILSLFVIHFLINIYFVTTMIFLYKSLKLNMELLFVVL